MTTKSSIISSNTPEGACHPDGSTMREIFTEQHKQLRKDGEEWMKTTSNSCMLVATLIATVVFAAVFTLPGGNKDDGTPVLFHKKGFVVFIVADALGLFSSSVSIMMFLSILTSRFAEDDFLSSLPLRLFIGLATLFISVACMDVAFGTTFFIFYNTLNARVPWLVAAMAFAPVISYSIFQYKLWAEIFQATFWSKSLFKPGPPKLLVVSRQP